MFRMGVLVLETVTIFRISVCIESALRYKLYLYFVSDVFSFLCKAVHCLPVQAPLFRFHSNHGSKIVLSNHQQTAEKQGHGSSLCSVLSSQPMEINHLYEVGLKKVYYNDNGVIIINMKLDNTASRCIK